MSGVQWKVDDAFWLLWLLPLVVLVAFRAHRRVRLAAHLFAGDVMTPRLMPPLRAAGPLRRTLLLLGALALVVAALARPAWDVYYVKTAGRGLDVVAVLDVSRSMLADDGGESRLARARSAIAWLSEEIAGDRLGLVCFAGETVLAAPLTLDRTFLADGLQQAGPDMVGRGGTAIGPALDEALRQLDASYDRDKLVLLVTDGDDQDTFPLKAADRLAERGIRVICLGIGRARAGEPLVLDGRVVRDRQGQPVPARLNEELLKEIATRTRGLYVPPEEAHLLPDHYRRYIQPLRKGESEEMQEKHLHERYQWFLGPALLLLLVQAGTRAYPRRRRGRRGPRLAAALLPLLLLAAGCSEDRAAERVSAGCRALEAADVAAAIDHFQAAEKGLADDPVVAYDLGTALQAAGRDEEARASYARVLERGAAELRARAHANMARMLVEELKQRMADGDPAASRAQREEVKRRADQALDLFQMSAELDPARSDSTRDLDALAAWLRVQEDRWAAADREAARKKRHARRGAAFLLGLLDDEHDLVKRLATGVLLADAALDQRDLADDLKLVPGRIADEQEGAPEDLGKELQSFVDAAGGHFGTAEAALIDARTEPAVRAIARGSWRLMRACILWADPGEVLPRMAAHEQRVLSSMQGLARSGKEQVPEALARELRATREELAVRCELLQRRLDQHPPEKLSQLLLKRARELLPRAARAGRKASRSLGGGEVAKAVRDATVSAVSLRRLAEEWRLAAQPAPALARTLELSWRDVARTAHAAWVEGRVKAPDLPASLSLRLARLGYLREAIARRVAEEEQRLAGTAKKDPGPDPEAEKRKQLRAAEVAQLRQALEGRLAVVEDYAETAIARAGDAAQHAGALAVMRHAREGLREVWLMLSPFEQLLRSAVEEQGMLTGGTRFVERLVKGDPEAESTAEAVQAGLPHAAREQALVTGLVRHLQARRPAELAQVGKPGDPAAEELPKEERNALAQVLLGLDELLEPARAASERAAAILAKGLGERERLQLTARITRLLAGKSAKKDEESTWRAFAEARPHQELALKNLREALRRFEEARMDLAQLATRVLTTDDRLLPPLREFAAGRAVQDSLGEPVKFKTLTERHAGLASYVARMDDALEQWLRRASQGVGPKDGKAQAPDPGRERAAAALRALVADLKQRNASADEAFGGADPAATLPLLEQEREAARALWLSLSPFKELLERVVAEEDGVLRDARRVTAADSEQQAQLQDLVRGVAAEQERARGIVPLAQAQLEAMQQQSQQQQQGGQDGQPAPGGLGPEVVALARKNLPLADAAMKRAADALGSRDTAAAVPHGDEARRLVQEILDAIRKQQQEQQKKQPDTAPERPTPEEARRLAQAVRERNRMKQKSRKAKRKPVERDW